MPSKAKKKKVEPTLSQPQLKQLVETLGSKDRLKSLVCCKDSTHGLEGIWGLDVDAIPEHVEWAAYVVTMTGNEQLLILDDERWREIIVTPG